MTNPTEGAHDALDLTARDVLRELVEWAGRMGGWEADAWEQAETVLAADPRQEPAPRLAVILEGGLVRTVICDHPDALHIKEVTIIDYDTERADDDECSLVPQSDGGTAPAFVTHHGFERSTVPLDLLAKSEAAQDAAFKAGWRLDWGATGAAANGAGGFVEVAGQGTGREDSEAADWVELCGRHGIKFEVSP